MSPESAISFLLIIYLFAITPGPGVFALLARSLASGVKPCISLALGMAVSDVIYLVLACFGLAVIAEQWAGLFMIIRFFGAFYLLYLGWKMWNASPDASLQNGVCDVTFTTAQGLLQGFLISASNPKVIFFYIYKGGTGPQSNIRWDYDRSRFLSRPSWLISRPSSKCGEFF